MIVPVLFAPQWKIPTIGIVRPCFDQITIVSPYSPGRLNFKLPVFALKSAAHSFDINTYQGESPHLWGSTMLLTCAGNVTPLQILKQYEYELGGYGIVIAELAFDVIAPVQQAAIKLLMELVRILGKWRHRRGYLRSEQEPDKDPPQGCTSGPTFYFEDRKSGVRLKCYARYEKLYARAFGKPIVRLEWTLSRKSTLDRYLGGNQIDNLLNADLNKFLADNLRLERVDHVAVGNLVRGLRSASDRDRRIHRPHTGRYPWGDPDYKAWRAAYLVLRQFACREYDRGMFASWDHAEYVCQECPAQIHGYLRGRRDGMPRSKRGRPKTKPRLSRRAITDHLIDRCFEADRAAAHQTPV